MVSTCITFCVDSVIPTKTVVTYPNNKPWVRKELKSVIDEKKWAYYTGDSLEEKVVSREVQNEIRKAKMKYSGNIEVQYSSGNLRQS